MWSDWIYNEFIIKKIVIVTGGSSGIGSCVAERLSKQGYQVYEFSRSGKSRRDIIHIDCDVTESEEI